jgi:hypothetical protein
MMLYQMSPANVAKSISDDSANRAWFAEVLVFCEKEFREKEKSLREAELAQINGWLTPATRDFLNFLISRETK